MRHNILTGEKSILSAHALTEHVKAPANFSSVSHARPWGLEVSVSKGGSLPQNCLEKGALGLLAKVREALQSGPTQQNISFSELRRLLTGCCQMVKLQSCEARPESSGKQRASSYQQPGRAPPALPQRKT